MELWHPALLGHRSVPTLWASAPKSERSERALGDVNQVPTSVQVYNACIYKKLRQCSDNCGLGLDHPTNHRIVLGDRGTSLRKYASWRIELEQAIDKKIMSATDVSKILWEAQMAHMEQRYVLCAVLLRRASELESAEACAMLAKMFGFGVQQAGTHLFERDSLRGIAWGIRALQLVVLDMERNVTSNSALQIMYQTLKLLCILVCSIESLQALRVMDSYADVSMALLLLFPRSCELLHPEARVKDTIPAELTRESIWSALRDVLCKVKATESMNREEEPGDSVSVEHDLTHIHLFTLFLESFLLMRKAVMEKEAAFMQETYEAWTGYLAETRSNSQEFTQFRNVASEVQQWAAPDAERSLNHTLSEAEMSAMFQRISSVFPFTCAKSKEPHISVTQMNEHRLKHQRSRRDLRASWNIPLRKPMSYPQPYSQIKPPSALSAPSTDHAMRHNTQRFLGSTSTKLRDVSNVMNRRILSADHACMMDSEPDDEAPYWSRMGDKVGKVRRRPSSVLSVTPSLMFPSKAPVDTNAPGVSEADTKQEHIYATSSTVGSTSDADRLRSRLRRQSSRASLHAAIQS